MIADRAVSALAREHREQLAASRGRAAGFRPRRSTRGAVQPPDPPAVVAKDRLEVWVATTVVSPNVREHPMTRAKRVKAQREAVALAVWCALRDPRGPGLAWTVTNRAAPKVITLTAHTAKPLDDDNLAVSLKAIRDGCMDAGLVQGDAERDGHQWVYRQVQDGRRGVTVAVRVREA